MIRGRWPPVAALLLVLGFAVPASILRAELSPTVAVTAVRTAVLSHSNSPYRTLAQAVAARESIPLVNSLAEALTLQPEFLLWVVSPTELSDRAMTSFNVALDGSHGRPSTGLVTGSTLEHARRLYERASGAKGERAAAVLGEDTFTSARLVETVNEQRLTRALTDTADVFDVLKRVDYVHYAGHGAGGYWRPLPNARIAAHDISSIGPLVISTMSCQTARIWEPSSIALRMVDRGAAAYSGFYYSPMAGYQIGEEDGPFRHTWPDVPIGHVVAAMNEGTRKGYARVPFHLLLGDPRIHLRSASPCALQDHGESDGVRTVSCSAVPSGLIPLRVRGGARYQFVDVAGSTTAWEKEPFYNRRLHMATIGEDRVLLIDHRGGDLNITLRQGPPIIWLATDPLVDALDSLLVTMADRRHGGDLIALTLAAIATPLAAGCARRRRLARVHVITAMAAGLVAGGLHAAYGVVRQQALVVIGKPIVFSMAAALGTAVLVVCGALIFFAARSWRGRLWGTVVATSVGWVGGIAALGVATFTSAAIAARTGIDVWIYRPDFYSFILSAAGCVVFGLVFLTVSRAIGAANEPAPITWTESASGRGR